jgi:heat shock protein HslJ
MNRLIASSLSTLLIVTSVGCGTDPVTPEPESEETPSVQRPELEDVLWRLLEYASAEGEMSRLFEGTNVEIEFNGGEMGGSSGCNRYFGSYTFGEGNHLAVGAEVGSTQMACPPEILEQEGRYQELLGRVAGAERIQDHLVLLDEGGEVLLKFVATQPATLENTSWQAAGIHNGKGGVVSTASTSASTALFAEGQLSGTGGCNQFTATFEIDGDKISIGPAAATRMFCSEPEGVMDQEQQYFEALVRARTFSLTPEKLELRDENGALQVGFRAVSE